MEHGSNASGLDAYMNPRSVAVIGASEDQSKFGGRLFRMLLKHGYDGRIYPINPARDTLFGVPAYPSVAALPSAPDMVVMAIPQEKVRDTVAACAQQGARCGIVITSKFSDAGEAGAAAEREVVAAARATGMRLIGPNCLGVISPANRLVLCSSPALEVDALLSSPIGFVSQSGALMATLFDRAHEAGIGFSHCVSVGNQADLELCDFVEWLIDDPATQVICTYIEGVKSPARLLQLARRARQAGKPWLAVKAGKTQAGSQAAFSHTASLAGDYAALQAVFERENIVLMEDPAAMLLLAAAMARHPASKLDEVAIITTSGGGGALSADRLSEAGVPLARFGTATQSALGELFTEGQAHNPIDLGGRRHEVGSNAADVSRQTAALALADPAVDGALVVLTTAPALHDVTAYLAEGVREAGKPALFVMQPGRAAQRARQALVAAGQPFTNNLAEAVQALSAWRRWSAYREPGVAQRPAGCAPARPPSGELGEQAAKQWLAGAGIPVNRERLAADVAQALEMAQSVGFPLVAKVVSPDIVHKSEVGGVLLGVDSPARLREGLQAMQARVARLRPDARLQGFSLQAMEAGELELLVGARCDPQFGAQVVVGSGGVLVETLQDIVVLPAPFDLEAGRQALARLRSAPLMQAYRGRGALDVDSVAQVMVRLGWLASDLAGQDFEIEINPLKVRLQGQGCVAVDARARLA